MSLSIKPYHVRKNDNQEIRAQLCETNGQSTMDVRVWQNSSGRWIPTDEFVDISLAGLADKYERMQEIQGEFLDLKRKLDALNHEFESVKQEFEVEFVVAKQMTDVAVKQLEDR